MPLYASQAFCWFFADFSSTSTTRNLDSFRRSMEMDPSVDLDCHEYSSILETLQDFYKLFNKMKNRMLLKNIGLHIKELKNTMERIITGRFRSFASLRTLLCSKLLRILLALHLFNWFFWSILEYHLWYLKDSQLMKCMLVFCCCFIFTLICSCYDVQKQGLHTAFKTLVNRSITTMYTNFSFPFIGSIWCVFLYANLDILHILHILQRFSWY